MDEYTIILKKTGSQYVSLCLELTIVGCGDTREEAIECVRDAIASYVDSIEGESSPDRPISIGVLHEFLSEGEERPSDMDEPTLKVLAYG